MTFISERDLAVCGLACVLCSDGDCPGCKSRGCGGSNCSIYQCASNKDIDGCYECDDFPCSEKMLQGVRNRAFNQYAKRHGKMALLTRLKKNFELGIAYHKPDGQKGDYDQFATESDIIRLIHFGIDDPYKKCPELETEHFLLRLVRMDDAENLLSCYSDAKARELFNADGCTSDFHYQTIAEMRECISFWLSEYDTESYVRFAIVDKSLGKAVGTIEMFGMIGSYKTPRGMLRLDIRSDYETNACLHELLALCAADFFMLFEPEEIITKASPSAAERIKVLSALGFSQREIPGRQHILALQRK